MTPDEARDLFTDAFDDALSAEARAEFDEVLRADADVKQEWVEFCALLRETAELGGPDDGDGGWSGSGAGSMEVDLLTGVQDRLRARSGGRFYRDRYSAEAGRGGGTWPLVLALITLCVLGVAYAGLHFAQELDEGTTAPLVTEPPAQP